MGAHIGPAGPGLAEYLVVMAAWGWAWQIEHFGSFGWGTGASPGLAGPKAQISTNSH